MFAEIAAERSEDEIRRVAVSLAKCFGAGSFWIERDKDQHALTAVDSADEWYELPTRRPDTRLVKLHTLARYYGRGYERGDILSIIGWAELIESKWPEARIFYGGDSGGYLGEFAPEQRAELKRYFFDVGHEPYCGHTMPGKPQPPVCEFCDLTANEHTWGMGFVRATCSGCAQSWIGDERTGRWHEMKAREKFDEARERILAAA